MCKRKLSSFSCAGYNTCQELTTLGTQQGSHMIFWSLQKSFGNILQLCILGDPRLWPILLHWCCSSWWLSQVTGISNTLGSSAPTGQDFHHESLIGCLQGANSQLHCITPLVHGLQQPLRQQLLHWPYLASHSSKLQLFSMIPSFSQNHDNLEDSYKVPGCQQVVYV